MAGVGFTPQMVIDEARTRMNDDAKKRATDAKCEKWVNECLRVMVVLAPYLFTKIVEIKPVPNRLWQNAALNATVITDTGVETGPNLNIVVLVKIITSLLGLHIHECDYHAAMTSNPLQATSAGLPRNWARVPEEEMSQAPTSYFLFPPPLTDDALVALCVVAPNYVAAGGTIFLPDVYRPLFVSYLIYVFNSVDDDYVVSQRAAQELQRFMTLLGLAGKTKQVQE